jgi:hypothetical protein
MPSINPYNPNLSGNGLVDQMIGKSYEVVRAVYDNLSYIKTVASNLGMIRNAANNIHRSIDILTGEAAGLGETAYLVIPSSILQEKILDFNVLLTGSDFAIYGSGQGYFTAKIFDGNLEVTLASDAPVVLIESTITLTLSYRN